MLLYARHVFLDDENPHHQYTVAAGAPGITGITTEISSVHPKEFFKRYQPAKHKLSGNRWVSFLGHRLHDPSLWHMNRRSASWAVATGLFIAFIPLPLHTPLATVSAVALRVNLPVLILSSWATNPVTVVPFSVIAYKIGAWLLGLPPLNADFEPTIDWVTSAFAQSWAPFSLGCLLLGAASAVVGYFSVQGLWRLHLLRRLKARRKQRCDSG
ncbi:MAG: DUF2062 domain-containing protein [Gammaproteobacteria bacterium]